MHLFCLPTLLLIYLIYCIIYVGIKNKEVVKMEELNNRSVSLESKFADIMVRL